MTRFIYNKSVHFHKAEHILMCPYQNGLVYVSSRMGVTAKKPTLQPSNKHVHSLIKAFIRYMQFIPAQVTSPPDNTVPVTNCGALTREDCSKSFARASAHAAAAQAHRKNAKIPGRPRENRKSRKVTGSASASCGSREPNDGDPRGWV